MKYREQIEIKSNYIQWYSDFNTLESWEDLNNRTGRLYS